MAHRSNTKYHSIIICKWQSNGIDIYDTRSSAYTDCLKIGYSLWSTEQIKDFEKNDQEMINKYLSSSNCGKYN